MGVYIKDMEIPTSCYDCPCCNGENGYCQLRKWYVYDEVPRSCPLAPVPPHGDLIDRDALMELYADADDMPLGNMKVPIAVIRQNIIDVPTIIEGDEE